MKKTSTQIMSIFLAFIITLGLGASSIYAEEPIYNLPSDNIQNMPPGNSEVRSVPTAAVKKAIRWALRHSDDLVRSASKYIGKDAAKVVEKNFAKAAPVLNKLLQYDTLVWQTVQDQLTHVVGRQAAIWIRMALEFML